MVYCSATVKALVTPNRLGRWAGVGSQLTLLGLLLAASGCGLLPKTQADAQSRRPGAERNGPTAVNVAIARTGALRSGIEYTGTTQPARTVSLRSQAEGRLLNLTVDVGDQVSAGETVAVLDDALLITAVNQAQAELAAQKSEVARAQAQVANVRTQVEEARLELQQSRADAARLQSLRREGAIALQAAEQAQTEANTAQQTLRSTQAQLATEQEAVAAAQARVAAQQAVLNQARERLSYAALAAPIGGAVLEKVTEPGNLVQPGSEVLRLGDFSQIKVRVQVSDLVLSRIRVGQAAQVRLDAFPQQSFTGKITRISPAADPTSRLIPVEVIIPNQTGQVSSGLLARVSFAERGSRRVIIPQTALQERETDATSQRPQTKQRSGPATLFVVTGEGEAAKAIARQVVVGDRADGRVEILTGLAPGERYIARAGKRLKDGETVRLSVLSETTTPNAAEEAAPRGGQQSRQGQSL